MMLVKTWEDPDQATALGLRLWHGVLALLPALALARFGAWMDGWEVGILFGASAALALGGQRWPALRALAMAVGGLSLAAVGAYGGALARADSSPWLKYLLASQAAIGWMGLCVWAATVCYWWGLRAARAQAWGRRLLWVAAAAGLVGLAVRWHESYLLGGEVGHVPVSNLYEVFVLFTVICCLMYLYLEAHSGLPVLGAFVLPPVAAAVLFLLWYGGARGAHQIQPLIPALQSYWMKLHVPANFIGYGGFLLGAALGLARLALVRAEARVQVWIEDWMYRMTAVGFVFFTIATILGALWAAEAWGAYWSWDPKEIWALAVWLNYAAWLHWRLVKQAGARALAWWSVLGFFITLFAFLGVNMFLAGLHAYGSL